MDISNKYSKKVLADKSNSVPLTTALPVHFSFGDHGLFDTDSSSLTLLLVQYKDRCVCVLTDVACFDGNGELKVPGASGLRQFNRQTLPSAGATWFYHGVIEIPFTERYYHSEIKDGLLDRYSFIQYLRAAVRHAIGRDAELCKIISGLNGFLRISAQRESFRAALDASDEEDTLSAIWNFEINPAIVSKYDPLNGAPLSIAPSKDLDSAIRSSASLLLEVPLILVVTPPILQKPTFARGSNKDVLELLAGGINKPMLACPEPNVVYELINRFPNFTEAILKVSKQLHLMRRSDKLVPLKLRPLLLVGDSGVGKSHFAWQLAKILGASTREVDFATATAGFVLAGSSPQWADAKCGMVFDELINGPSGNPFFICNEIDKSVQDGVRFPPTGPLYTLLEPDTSSRFVDEFAETPLDASYISWILTANDVTTIPPPLLHRMDVVHIPSPSQEQLLVIGQNIYHALLVKEPWGDTFPEHLENNVLQLIAMVGSPRKMKSLIIDALGTAAEQSANQVLPEHVVVTAVKKRTIGFS